MMNKLPWDCLPLREFLDFLEENDLSMDALSDVLGKSPNYIRNMDRGTLMEAAFIMGNTPTRGELDEIHN